MKIAIIGGGTAGYIAAAHLTKHFPQCELYHIYDSRLPTIGVGEGTTLPFVKWLENITNLSYQALEQRCYITKKMGIKFENWGTKYQEFMHHFHPAGKAYSYHISADKLVNLLKEYVIATYVDKKIIELNSNGQAVNIVFEDNTDLEVDLAIDGGGFPKAIPLGLPERQHASEHIALSLIPTNAALIRQGPLVNEGIVAVNFPGEINYYHSATESIARPHGWIFVIHLTTRTAYGYIYNSKINSVEDIEKDFQAFFQEKRITPFPKPPKHLNFPNFTQNTFFDGSLFKIGNAASFLEPLEATAIGFILAQIEILSCWAIPKLLKEEKRGKFNEKDLKVINSYFRKYAYKMEMFVSWHYAKGSCFESDFWRFATNNFYQQINKMPEQNLLTEFEKNLEAASKLSHSIEQKTEFFQQVTALKSLLEKINNNQLPNFAQWEKPSFAEMGYGIGYFS